MATAAVLVLSLVVGSALIGVGAGSLVHPDGLDYAQIARELFEGRGFSSKQAIYALHLRFLLDHELLSSDWPSLHRFPLLSFVEAIAFRLFGVADAVVFGVGTTLWASTVTLVFHWAWRAVGALPAAGVAALLAFNGSAFFAVQAGLPEPLAGFLTTACLYVAWQHRRAPSMRRAAAAGAFLGLAVLARTNVVTLFPFVIVDLMRADSSNRRRLALAAFAAFVVVCSPWWVRNVQVAGSPTYSLHSYFLLPAFSDPGAEKRNYSLPWVRDFVSPVDYALENPRPVAQKWFGNGGDLLRSLPTFAGTLGISIVALLALWRRGGGTLQTTAAVSALGFVANAMLCGFTDFNLESYYTHLLPVMALLAVAATWNLASRISSAWARAAAFGFAIVVMSNPAALVAALERAERNQASVTNPAHLEFIERNTAPEALVFSDRSIAITWRTGRRTIRHHFEDWPQGRRVLSIMSFEREFGPIDAIYLSPALMHGPLGSTLNYLRSDDPQFERTFSCRKFPDGALFCDRRNGAA